MIKLILVVLAIGAFFFRMQSKGASRRAQGNTRERAKQLAAGNFETLAAELDLPVRQKTSEGFSVELLYSGLEAFRGKQLSDKFRLLDLRHGKDGDLLVLADGKTQELIPTRAGNEFIDRFYSCCIYVHLLPEEGRVAFRSSFPEDKEHQYLLEDLADVLYDRGRQNV